MKRSNSKGFTIVELVIVIAIIAILSAILIPVFGNVIENANDTADAAALRDAYAQAYLEYSQKLVKGEHTADYQYEAGQYYFTWSTGTDIESDIECVAHYAGTDLSGVAISADKEVSPTDLDTEYYRVWKNLNLSPSNS